MILESASDLPSTAHGQKEKNESVNQGNKPEISSEDMMPDSEDYLFYDVSSQ